MHVNRKQQEEADVQFNWKHSEKHSRTLRKYNSPSVLPYTEIGHVNTLCLLGCVIEILDEALGRRIPSDGIDLVSVSRSNWMQVATGLSRYLQKHRNGFFFR